MDIRYLRAALAVRDHGSFTTAAEQLFMAQSTLSRQVSALERHLGAQIFRRGARRAEPTPLGRLFLDEAQNILRAVEAAEQAVRTAA